MQPFLPNRKLVLKHRSAQVTKTLHSRQAVDLPCLPLSSFDLPTADVKVDAETKLGVNLLLSSLNGEMKQTTYIVHTTGSWKQSRKLTASCIYRNSSKEALLLDKHRIHMQATYMEMIEIVLRKALEIVRGAICKRLCSVQTMYHLSLVFPDPVI
jgi:hypothetical protein